MIQPIYEFNPGDGANSYTGSDCYPYHVVKVSLSKKTVWVVQCDWKMGPGRKSFNLDSSHASPEDGSEFTPRLDGEKFMFKLAKDGYYRRHKHMLGKGYEAYMDPCF